MVRWFPVLLASLALFAAGCGDDGGDDDTASAPEPQPVAWSYEKNGGVEGWAELSEDYAACEEGMEQSPVNLAEAEPGPLPSLDFDYNAGPAEVENTGHTAEVDYEKGASSVSVGGTKYFLIQSHFHLPSEHEIDSVQDPIEMHFVHSTVDAELLVVGAFVKVGEPNSAWDPIAAALPAKEGETVELDEVSPLDLLPQDVGQGPRWHYDGSLTAPPCSEGVDWNVLKTRITMSPQQILEFKSVSEGNRRPVQPLNEREVVYGSAE